MDFPFSERWALLAPDFFSFLSLLRDVGSSRPWTCVHYSSLNLLFREVGTSRLMCHLSFSLPLSSHFFLSFFECSPIIYFFSLFLHIERDIAKSRMSYFMACSLIENAYFQVRSSINGGVDDLDVYEKLSRIINTRTHHIWFFKKNQESSFSRNMINSKSTFHELSFKA
jgi:hypothetical protein